MLGAVCWLGPLGLILSHSGEPIIAANKDAVLTNWLTLQNRSAQVAEHLALISEALVYCSRF